MPPRRLLNPLSEIAGVISGRGRGISVLGKEDVAPGLDGAGSVCRALSMSGPGGPGRAGERCTRQPRGEVRPDGSSGRSRVQQGPAAGLTPQPPEKFARPRHARSAALHLLVAAAAELRDGAQW